jgi:hypothetical protein
MSRGAKSKVPNLSEKIILNSYLPAGRENIRMAEYNRYTLLVSSSTSATRRFNKSVSFRIYFKYV